MVRKRYGPMPAKRCMLMKRLCYGVHNILHYLEGVIPDVSLNSHFTHQFLQDGDSQAPLSFDHMTNPLQQVGQCYFLHSFASFDLILIVLYLFLGVFCVYL